MGTKLGFEHRTGGQKQDSPVKRIGADSLPGAAVRPGTAIAGYAPDAPRPTPSESAWRSLVGN